MRNTFLEFNRQNRTIFSASDKFRQIPSSTSTIVLIMKFTTTFPLPFISYPPIRSIITVVEGFYSLVLASSPFLRHRSLYFS